MVNGGRHLVDRSGYLIGFALLAEHALTDILHIHRQQFGIGVQAAGGLIDGADDAQITALHGIEGTGHLAHFVAARERHAGVQITTFFHLQHHVLEGVEVHQKEVDQQLRGRQQCQHQDTHHHGVAEGALLEYLQQAWRMGQHGEPLTVGEVNHFGPDQRLISSHGLTLKVDPALGVGQFGSAGPAWRCALGKAQQVFATGQRLLCRPAGQ